MLQLTFHLFFALISVLNLCFSHSHCLVHSLDGLSKSASFTVALSNMVFVLHYTNMQNVHIVLSCMLLFGTMVHGDILFHLTMNIYTVADDNKETLNLET